MSEFTPPDDQIDNLVDWTVRCMSMEELAEWHGREELEQPVFEHLYSVLRMKGKSLFISLCEEAGKDPEFFITENYEMDHDVDFGLSGDEMWGQRR